MGLGNIDTAWARQPRTDHRGNQARGEHAMGYSALKPGLTGVLFIQVYRVGIPRYAGKGSYIGFCDRSTEDFMHPFLQFLKIVAVKLFQYFMRPILHL